DLAAMDPAACYLGWTVALISQKAQSVIQDEFMFIEDDLAELTIQPSTEDLRHGDWRLGNILTERGDISPSQLNHVLQQQSSSQEIKPLGTLLQETGSLPKEVLKSALDTQSLVRNKQMADCRREENTSIRVSSDKLDQLVNQVGELVIAQARLKQLVSHLRNEHGLQTVAEEITLLAEGLRDSTMSIRLLPIETLFQKFTRLVRDLSKELGKQVRFVTEGGETELDKTVIEHLNDPLVHLLRNSVDHGLETPEVRTGNGKPADGMVRLSASHAGANVIIRIEDDGKGIDTAVLLAKARERGLVRADAELSDKEIFNLIFLPGFSTKTEVTAVSGRGVGMDVVKRNIEAMRGTIQVESHVGQGSVITIKLPLTLAIIDGFLVQVADERYVIPLSAVRECVRLTHKDVEASKGRHIIKIRNEIVPYIRLRELFNLPGQPPVKEQVVITEIDSHRVGLVVDVVLGQNQVVIKSLGILFNSVRYFSGTTILGDGEVAPILDVGGILEHSIHTLH
ncbi:MAG: chemotaxis protein CheA, partial [Magnetococcales bacterium]|nr:chemotaxis protein CheA [Magnetococcales bacterium]